MSFKRGKRPATILVELQDIEDEFNKETGELKRRMRMGECSAREFELIHTANIAAWVRKANAIIYPSQSPIYPPFYRVVMDFGVDEAAKLLRMKGGYLNDFQTPPR